MHNAPLLTPEDVAALLQVTVKAVYGKVERGQLPGVVRVGRQLRFRRTELYKALGLAA